MLSVWAMRKTLVALVALLTANAAPAEILISNVNGIQVAADGKLEHFGALLVGEDGRVKQLFVNPTPRLNNVNRTIDEQGRTMLPGLIDAHGHVVESSGGDIGLGMMLLQLDLNGTSSIADMKERLRIYTAANPGKGWVRGRGWNQELWEDKTFPTAADLDAVVSRTGRSH